MRIFQECMIYHQKILLMKNNNMGCAIQNSAQAETQSEIITQDVQITAPHRIFELSNSENLIEIQEESPNKTQVPIFKEINHLQEKTDSLKHVEMVFTSVDNSDEEIKLVKSILRKRSDLIHKYTQSLRRVQFNLQGNEITNNDRDHHILKRHSNQQYVTMQQLENEFQ
ncbi:hypothetical protein pb186bvf_012293 [Paramecium bursaria]